MDIEKSNKVSIVIPTYNRALYIPRAIESIFKQTYSNYEIIVVDDASSDNTHDVISKIIERYPAYTIRYILNSVNMGAQASRNIGIKTAIGNWISFLDSDDEWMPNMLSTSMQKAVKEKYDVVYSEGLVVWASKNQPVPRGIKKFQGYVYKEMLGNAGPMFQSMVIKKDSLIEVGLLDEKQTSHQEWDTAIRLAQKNEFGFIDIPLFIWHKEGHESISNDLKRNIAGHNQIVEKYKSEIIKCLGAIGLIDHYRMLAYKSLELTDKKLANHYFTLAICYSNRMLKPVIMLQRCCYNIINPKLLDFKIISGRLCRIFQKLVARRV